MLKGKIISIEYHGLMDWRLTIDGKLKEFTTYVALESYLVWVYDKVKDQDKKKLLKQDLECLFAKTF
jgi:hypothetical protein